VERDRPRVLALGQSGELRVTDDLQERETRHHGSERDGEHRRQDEDPRPESAFYHGIGSLTG
jgi:hypothetical protein